jgi:3-methyladenine DNA glycosylase/8-oxoguanine DNA glycosylase
MSEHAEALEHLAARDPRFARAIQRFGPCGLERGRSAPFDALLQSIVHQQLAGAAARTIHGRVLALFPRRRPSAELLGGLPDEALRAAGLSRNKLAAVRDLAAHTTAGNVPDRRTLAKWTDDEIVDKLTAVRGIGRWTVEMFLLFELGRPDVLPLDDLGVRKGFTRVFGSRGSDRLDREHLAERGERWRPHRSVATWYLWRLCELPGRKTAVKKGVQKAPAKSGRKKGVR